MIKFIELFAGIGGFRYGLEWVQLEDKYLYQPTATVRDKDGQSEQQFDKSNKGLFDCVYANEWDRYASSIYRYHYGEIDTADITTVDADRLPDHDLLTGGFPCQAFSIAGKRKGFEDTRGTLFFEIARILKTKRPKYCLLENVKGLLSHDRGRTFQTILSTLDELGYDLQWQVLNSKDFGVPQNRERVFIVGHIRGQRRPEIFPIRQIDKYNVQEYGKKNTQGEIAQTVTTTYWKGAKGSHIDKGMTMIADYRYDEGLRIRKNNISPTVRQEFKGQDISKSALLIHNVYGGFGEKEFREFSDYSPTIRTNNADLLISCPKGGGHLPMVKKEMKIRRLTPVECERLQAFPDNYTKFGIDEKGNEILISDTQRYKCLGNAVTTSVITEIGKLL